MSIKALNWALDVKNITCTNKLVLIVLSNYSNDDDICYPSLNTIQDKCCLSRPAVISNIKKLIDHKLIKKVSSEYINSKYKNQLNCYKILVNEVNQLAKVTSKPNSVTSNPNLPTSNPKLPELVNEVNPNHHVTNSKPLCNLKGEKTPLTKQERILSFDALSRLECNPTQNEQIEFGKFLDYWTESNTGAKKFKAETQKIFDTVKRWKRWQANNFGSSNKQIIETEGDDSF